MSEKACNIFINEKLLFTSGYLMKELLMRTGYDHSNMISEYDFLATMFHSFILKSVACKYRSPITNLALRSDGLLFTRTFPSFHISP